MSKSPSTSTSQPSNARRATRTDAAVIAQYIQDLWAGFSRPAAPAGFSRPAVQPC